MQPAEIKIRAATTKIALPNDASIALHEKFAMTQVAEFKQVGFKFDQWLDVGYWQVLLKHRSLAAVTHESFTLYAGKIFSFYPLPTPELLHRTCYLIACLSD